MRVSGEAFFMSRRGFSHEVQGTAEKRKNGQFKGRADNRVVDGCVDDVFDGMGTDGAR